MASAHSYPALNFKFTASNPELVKLTCIRHKTVDEATDGGKFVIDSSVIFMQLDDHPKRVIAGLQLDITGTSPDDSIKYFDINMELESLVTFVEEPPEDIQNNDCFAQFISDTSVSRTIHLVEEMAWRMGYYGFSIDLTLPLSKDVKNEAKEYAAEEEIS